MKKRFFRVSLVLALTSSLLFTSCIGSFGLTNKFLNWNKQTTNSKFLNELIFIGLHIVPAYPISYLADLFVLNSIEFWSGNQPVHAGVIKKVKGEDGNIYTVETLKNGYKISNESGKEMSLVYDKKSKTWNVESEGSSIKLIKVIDEEKAVVYLPNGKEKEIELSNEGILAFRQFVEGTKYMASK